MRRLNPQITAPLCALVLFLTASVADAETFFLRQGEVLEGRVVEADETTIWFQQEDQTVLEIPISHLDPLSVYRAFRSIANLNKGSERVKLGDRCMALGLPDMALKEYEAAAARGVSAETIRAKKSLARSVLAYNSYEDAVVEFEKGSFVSAKAMFERFLAEHADRAHLVSAARGYLLTCDEVLAPVSNEAQGPATEEEDKQSGSPPWKLKSIDRSLRKIEELIDKSTQVKRKTLLAGDSSQKSRGSLMQAVEKSKRAHKEAVGLTKRMEGLPDSIVAEVQAAVKKSKESLIDSYLKVSHLHVLVGDYGRARDFVMKVLGLDPKNASAKSLLRLIEVRALEADAGDDGTTLVDPRRYRTKRVLDRIRSRTPQPPGRVGAPPPPARGGSRAPAPGRGGSAPRTGPGPRRQG